MMKEKVLIIKDMLPETMEEKINHELSKGWIIKAKDLSTVSGLYIPGHVYRGIITFEKKI